MASIHGKMNATKGLRHFEGLADRLVRATNEEIQLATLKVHETAVKSIQANGDGETETRSNPTRTVSVSRPGEPPNTDTGRLVKSIQFEFEEGAEGFTGYVGTNLKYGAHLELGTSKMEPRPWLRPALEVARQYLKKIMRKRLAEEAKKGTS